ncbi:MAG: GNAT family N-acyltransferase [Thermodesulfobacteriota bacterium]
MDKLIDLSETIEKPFNKILFSFLQQPVERFLGIDSLNGCYARFREKAEFGIPFRSTFETILDTLNVHYSCNEALLQQVPVSGPLVVVSNHPFGGLDGIILGSMMSKIRSDVRILGNYLLKQIDGLEERIIAVNPFENRNIHENYAGLKQALQWLGQGGALIVFPSGEVASWNRKRQAVTDPEWSSHIAALIRKTRATTLPVYFPGRNSALFSLAGLLSPRLRTLMLPRELINKGNQSVTVHIGRPIAWSFLKRRDCDKELIDYLRTTTEILQYQANDKPRGVDERKIQFISNRKTVEPLIAQTAADTIRREIDTLPDDQILVSSGEHVVYIATSTQIPNVLREIGRLREQAFRAVGEGTGRSIDVDRFDVHYRHLFLYNRKTNEVIGGYRLGLVKEILDSIGRKGLYTNTLFRFHPSFFDPADRMIEFGRSFVRVEYQRKNNCLITIWKGIGEFIRRNPQYRMLYGPVSIRNDYHDFSKKLMIDFLSRYHGDPGWSSRVKPRHPYLEKARMDFRNHATLSYDETIEDVAHWISQIEPDGKGIPTMLKHYLKLNGKVLCFNIDQDFSNVIDGLILVDLDNIHAHICRRFIGASDV